MDAYQRGHFATVSAAIEAAKPGDRILVRPGLYQESLTVDKPLEIIGDGPVGDIEIRGRDSHVLQFRASIGRVANLTLRQAETDVLRGVMIYQGRLDLEGCDISSRAGSCVYIVDGADPVLRRNQIHENKASGVFVYFNGLGTLEGNEIIGNSLAGVAIESSGNPTVRGNRINRNGYAGVWVYEAGKGVIEDNDLTENAEGALTIARGYARNVTRARNKE